MHTDGKHDHGAKRDELEDAHKHADPKGDEAGEDEGGVPSEGHDKHVKEDQKPIVE